MTDEAVPGDEAALFERRDQAAARDELAARYDGLARGLARRYAGRGEPRDDLVQVARLGLINAIDRFDADRNIRFATFATRTIVGELKRHLRDKTWSVRVPRSIQERWLEASRATEDLTQRLGRSPTIAEVADLMGATTEDVLEALDAGDAYTAASLDRPVGTETDSTTVGELVPDAGLSGFEHAEDRVELAHQVERLPARERTILYLRFFEGKTQSEIAADVGVSQMHVSRLLRSALQQLRSGLEVSA